ncbi:MAG: hypothetical protein HZB66_01245 [Candidatus Aenigmarchaeota archaeon]|nr:hypothetical protein [Candidatus Aenigmarchaeota archaeon]
MADRSSDIGKGSTGRRSLSSIRLGRKEKPRRIINLEMRRRIEKWRDNVRMKLMYMRQRYEERVQANERNMAKKKEGREKNLNPLSQSLMPSPKYAKMLRNPANWSSVPQKPKYSGAITTRKRIYGKRFGLVDHRE